MIFVEKAPALGRIDCVQFHGLAILTQLKSRCHYTTYPVQSMSVIYSKLRVHFQATISGSNFDPPSGLFQEQIYREKKINLRCTFVLGKKV
jgi:hypothetical protein